MVGSRCAIGSNFRMSIMGYDGVSSDKETRDAAFRTATYPAWLWGLLVEHLSLAVDSQPYNTRTQARSEGNENTVNS